MPSFSISLSRKNCKFSFAFNLKEHRIAETFQDAVFPLNPKERTYWFLSLFVLTATIIKESPRRWGQTGHLDRKKEKNEDVIFDGQHMLSQKLPVPFSINGAATDVQVTYAMGTNTSPRGHRCWLFELCPGQRLSGPFHCDPEGPDVCSASIHLWRAQRSGSKCR